MDPFRIDGHKLLYHPHRVSDWVRGADVYPIYMEISPTSACNHRCVFCALDFIGYPKNHLETRRLKEVVSEIGRLGVKSIMYAGEGEPFMHNDMVEIIRHTHASGIDVAVTTNAVLMKPDLCERILDVTEWIKVSCNAGSAATYSKIHRAASADFDVMVANLEQAVKIKSRRGYACTLGVQILLLPENENEVETLALTARDLGLDYLVVKPFSQHPRSRNARYKDIAYDAYAGLAENLEKLNTPDFNVVFRLDAMRRWDAKDKPYGRCLALPFWSYLDAVGNVWGCSVFIEDDRFRYGNIYEQTFREIWEGEKRRTSMQFVKDALDPADCRVNCRMDAINRYLWGLRHPPPHVNFI